MNWTRLLLSRSDAASARTSSVLATPGTPSSSTWPWQSSAITSPVTTASWPTTALATSARTAPSAALGSSGPDQAAGRRPGWGTLRRGALPGGPGRCGRAVGRRLVFGVHCVRTSLSRASRSWARATSAASSPGAGPNSMASIRAAPPADRAESAGTISPGAGAGRQPERGQGPGQHRGPERGRGPVPGPARLVEPGVTLHGLRGPHHDRQPLGDQRPEPARPPQRGQHHGQAELDHHQVGRQRDQLGQRLLAARGAGQAEAAGPARRRGARASRFRARAALPLPGQAAVGQRVPGAEHGDHPPGGPVPHQRGRPAHGIAQRGRAGVRPQGQAQPAHLGAARQPGGGQPAAG